MAGLAACLERERIRYKGAVSFAAEGGKIIAYTGAWE